MRFSRALRGQRLRRGCRTDCPRGYTEDARSCHSLPSLLGLAQNRGGSGRPRAAPAGRCQRQSCSFGFLNPRTPAFFPRGLCSWQMFK